MRLPFALKKKKKCRSWNHQTVGANMKSPSPVLCVWRLWDNQHAVGDHPAVHSATTLTTCVSGETSGDVTSNVAPLAPSFILSNREGRAFVWPTELHDPDQEVLLLKATVWKIYGYKLYTVTEKLVVHIWTFL